MNINDITVTVINGENMYKVKDLRSFFNYTSFDYRLKRLGLPFTTVEGDKMKIRYVTADVIRAVGEALKNDSNVHTMKLGFWMLETCDKLVAMHGEKPKVVERKVTVQLPSVKEVAVESVKEEGKKEDAGTDTAVDTGADTEGDVETSALKAVYDTKVFNNPEFGNIRVVMIDGEPWFVGKDVCIALGYKDAINAMKDHVFEEDKKGWRNATKSLKEKIGRGPGVTFINRSGLYSLILSSKLESAKRFKRWVTSEVLPMIEQTGVYMDMKTLDQFMTDPATFYSTVKAWWDEREKRINLEKEVDNLSKQVEANAPKVNYADAVAGTDGYINIRMFCKEMYDKQGLRINVREMYSWLRNEGILDQNNVAYQQYIKAGYFKVFKAYKKECNRTFLVSMLSPEGEIWLCNYIRKKRNVNA